MQKAFQELKKFFKGVKKIYQLQIKPYIIHIVCFCKLFINFLFTTNQSLFIKYKIFVEAM